jgi:1,4-alpha-glucan branching enzyme
VTPFFAHVVRFLQDRLLMLRKRRFMKENVVKVTFALSADVARESVRVVGEFNAWEGMRLERQQDGEWRATVALSAGRDYEFRYLIDNEQWLNDPNADGYVRNPFGQENSVVST